MNKKLQALKYVLFDFLAASIAWSIFYRFRKLAIEPEKFGYDIPVNYDDNFYLGLIIIPLFWVTLYALTGFYKDSYRKARLKEFGQTLLMSIIGCTIIFFAFLLDDEIQGYEDYYRSYVTLFSLHFVITFFLRFILTTQTVHRIQTRQIGFKTVIIGANDKACKLYEEMESEKKSYGNKFIGFFRVDKKDNYPLEDKLKFLGNVNELRKTVREYQVEEAIIAIESSEHDSLNKIINQLEGEDVIIKVIPDMYDILTGSVKMTAIFGAPLIIINREIMPVWQQSFKRILDIITALFVVTIFSPVFIFTALIVKLTSKGSIIFSQERIGIHGKPFNIYKFRSMFTNAEHMGPQLSSKNDPRITPFGRFMRKVRLDEIPQFFNVLKGDMSLVGPRPERQFYIDQIVEQAPHYNHLLKVRPGITSWGQVKYGYAENVNQMVARLKYDILYIENMSLLVDFKILIYTVMIVLQGRGK